MKNYIAFIGLVVLGVFTLGFAAISQDPESEAASWAAEQNRELKAAACERLKRTPFLNLLDWDAAFYND